jgi:hypothetical protein
MESVKENKKWYQSRTIYLHIASVTVAVTGVALQSLGALELTPVQQIIALMGLTFINNVAGIILRVDTDAPITL